MEDLDNLKTPDAYVDNHGVEVTQNKRDPQHGQVIVRIIHNSFQSSNLQMGLEQATELHEKLGALISELAPKFVVGTKVRILSTVHDDMRGQTGVVEYIMPSGNLQVGVGAVSMITTPSSVEAVE